MGPWRATDRLWEIYEYAEVLHIEKCIVYFADENFSVTRVLDL